MTWMKWYDCLAKPSWTPTLPTIGLIGSGKRGQDVFHHGQMSSVFSTAREQEGQLG
jgi:hypothetical protein